MTISATSQGLKPGVCTSSNRPANPYDGMMIYETDTNLVRIWNGTAWKTLAYSDYTSGAVLQVATATYSTQTTSSSSTFSDTGLSASIAPISTSHKVLVIVQQAGCGKTGSDTECQLQLLRGSTSISTFATQVGLTSSTANNIVGTQGVVYLDSPSTTSSTTYKTQFRSVGNTANAVVQGNGCMSTITLMEIAG